MKSRSTRASHVKLLAVLLAFTLIAAACGGGDDDSASTEASTDSSDEASPDDSADDADDADEEEDLVAPTIDVEEEPEVAPDEIVKGGVLRVAVEADGDGLNPASNNFAVSAYLMAFPIFDPLFAYDEEGKWYPYLAESATPVEGTNSWQVKLREGVLFHDGSTLGAEDVIATFNATLADPLISLAVAPSYPAADSGLPAIEMIDELTVQYNPIYKWAHFPVNLTSQLGMILPSEYIAAAAEDPKLDQMPIGQGPFKIELRVPDDRTILRVNPDYWQGTDNIHLDGIELIVDTDSARSAERVAAGEIDIQITSSPDAILTLREADSVSTIENVLSGENNIMMNTSKAPFDDIRVRKALTFATDREGYATLIGQGTSELADSMFHPDLLWHNPRVKQEGNMPELAGPLIDSYCGDFPDNCTDGKVNMELQYSGPSVVQTRVADLLSQSWSEFFNVTDQELLQDAHIIDVALGVYDVVTWRQFGAVDPDNEVIWLQCATASGFIALNWVRVCDEARDVLMFEQRATEDLERRRQIWWDIQAEMNATYAYIFTTRANWTVGSSERVRNVCGQKGPNGESMFCNNQGRQFFHNIWLAN